MGMPLAIHHYPFKLAHDSFWPLYNMEAFFLRHHPFKTSFFLERSMTYPVRLQETYWLPFVETNITLCGGLIRSPFAVHAHVRCRRLRLHSPFNGRVRVFSLATERTRERLSEVCAF